MHCDPGEPVPGDDKRWLALAAEDRAELLYYFPEFLLWKPFERRTEKQVGARLVHELLHPLS